MRRSTRRGPSGGAAAATAGAGPARLADLDDARRDRRRLELSRLRPGPWRGAPHRPRPSAKPALDSALRAFVAGLGLALASHAPGPPRMLPGALLETPCSPCRCPPPSRRTSGRTGSSTRVCSSRTPRTTRCSACCPKLSPASGWRTSSSTSTAVHHRRQRAHLWLSRLIRRYGLRRDLFRYEAKVAERARLLGASARPAQLSQLVSAALGGSSARRTSIGGSTSATSRPRLRTVPNGQDAGAGSRGGAQPSVRSILGRGELRLGSSTLCPICAQGGEFPARGGVERARLGDRAGGSSRVSWPGTATYVTVGSARWVDVKPGVPAPTRAEAPRSLLGPRGGDDTTWRCRASSGCLGANHRDEPDWTCATTVMSPQHHLHRP